MRDKVIAFVLVFSSMSLADENYLRAEFMPVAQAEKKWGIEKFVAANFTKAISKNRAKMAVDLVKNQVFVGKEIQEVRRSIGEPTGFFFSDVIPAYLITSFTKENPEIWQLVFIPDKTQKYVSEVKIHKKCCYNLGIN